MNADNHRGQEDKSFQQQAGYMRAMIFSHINDFFLARTGWVHICAYAVRPSLTVAMRALSFNIEVIMFIRAV